MAKSDSDGGLPAAAVTPGEMREIRNVLMDIRERIVRMETMAAAHQADLAIHTRPPCEYQKELQRSILRASFAAIGALLASGWALVMLYIKGHNGGSTP